MIRKSKIASAAGAAALIASIASAHASGAYAQEMVPGIPETGSPARIVPPPFELIQNPAAVVQAGFAAPRIEAESVAPGAASLAELVNALDAPQGLSRDLNCLASAIYFEARGEPLLGQLAVGSVVVNRAGSGRFPSSYCGVVYQPSQFSFVRGGRMPSINRDSKAWQQAKVLATIADEGLWASPARDALFFHATHVRPGWKLKRIAQVNTHIFYR